jgi:hypothetical protein
MPDYMNGKIYELRSYKRPDLIYIGSTTQALSERKRGHKKSYNRWLEGKTNYTSSFEIVALGDCYIELKERYSCNSKEELNKREGEVIREMDCVNKCIPGRTQKEYREENKEQILERKKEYRQNNREQISEYNKEYHQKNREQISEKKKEKVTCECGRTVRKSDLPKHKRSKVHQNYIDLCWWT